MAFLNGQVNDDSDTNNDPFLDMLSHEYPT